MGRKCIDERCPYLASDGTCLLPECDLKDKCLSLEFPGLEEAEEIFGEDFVRERLKALGVLQ